MRRLAAVTAAAVLGSACAPDNLFDEGSVPPMSGSVRVFWDFVRNAPAQTNGYVIYDQSLVGSGTGPCAESGVEVVEFNVPGATEMVPCVLGGVQGVGITEFPPGTHTVTFHGWKKVGGVDTLVFDESASVQVPDRGVTYLYLDMAAVAADIDVVAYFDHQSGGTVDATYATCADAINPSTDWQIWDSSGTLIDSGTVDCTAGSALGLPIVVSTLDLDDYTTRLQGYTSGFVDPVFDSCPASLVRYLSIPHVTAEIGASAWQIDLYTPPFCPPTP